MAVGEVGADAIRLARFHRREQLVHHADGRIPLGSVGAGAVHPGLVDLGHTVGQMLQALPAVVLGRLPQHATARDLDVAHQRIEDQRRAADVERLLVTRRHPARMEDHVRHIAGDLVGQRRAAVRRARRCGSPAIPGSCP